VPLSHGTVTKTPAVEAARNAETSTFHQMIAIFICIINYHKMRSVSRPSREKISGRIHFGKTQKNPPETAPELGILLPAMSKKTPVQPCKQSKSGAGEFLRRTA